MYYALAPLYLLRGWQNATSVIVRKTVDTCLGLSSREFGLMNLCDGETEIEKIVNDPEDLKFLTDMEQKGIIIRSDEKKPITDEQKYRFYDNRYFSSILWSITGKCNFRCRHCYMDAPEGMLGELSTDEMKSIVDQIYDCGIRLIDLTGGEPFVRKDFWELTDYILGKGMYIGKIYTNGWLLNENVIQKLNERNFRPNFSLSFDCLGWHDWMRGVPGAEERAIKALKLCRDAGLNTDVEICLHKGNIHKLRETINFLASIGVSAVKTGSVVNTPLWLKNSDGYNLTKKEYYDACLKYVSDFYEDGMPMNVLLGGAIHMTAHSKKHHAVMIKAFSEEGCLENLLCGSARFTAYITPEGRFIPCMSITSMEEQEKFPLIRDIGVKRCMSDGYYLDFIGKRVKDLFERNPKCRECKYRIQCCGGCRACAMQSENGDWFASDPEVCFLFENDYPQKFMDAAEAAIDRYCKDDADHDGNQ